MELKADDLKSFLTPTLFTSQVSLIESFSFFISKSGTVPTLLLTELWDSNQKFMFRHIFVHSLPWRDLGCTCVGEINVKIGKIRVSKWERARSSMWKCMLKSVQNVPKRGCMFSGKIVRFRDTEAKGENRRNCRIRMLIKCISYGGETKFFMTLKYERNFFSGTSRKYVLYK